METDRWPAWWRLIRACRPPTVVGEQVAAAGQWFDRVCGNLEAVGYEVGAAILPAFSVGQDHRRERIFFVGDTHGNSESRSQVDAEASGVPGDRSDAGGVAPSNGVSPRVGQLRAYGNAIVPQLGAEFLMACMDRTPHQRDSE